jgi:ribosomal protein L11 methyltransferase
VEVPPAEAEAARAVFVDLFPAGFEERDRPDGLEFAVYTDAEGAAWVRRTFGGAAVSEVAPGWEERWRDFHRPVRVGALWIGPPWETPPRDAIPLVIEPARAFGTGGHPTTRLCLELLADLRSELGTAGVLDVGCGSGVLAIAAALLGYRPVRAIDVDATAVEETRRNAEANKAAVEVSLGDALVVELPPADVAVANLSSETIGAIAPRLRCRLLIASGYLETESIRLGGYRRLRRRAADGWAADVYARGGHSAQNRHNRV